MSESERTPHRRIGRITSAGLGVAALVALSVAFDGRPAQASCGDYVMIGGHDAHAPRQGSADLPRSTDHQGPGCRGANCRARLPLPAAPFNSLRDMTPPHWAWRRQALPADAEFSSALISDEYLLICEGHALGLLRPPSRCG